MINLSYCVYLLVMARLEARRAYSQEWHKKHPGYSTKNSQQWRASNAARQKEWSKEYHLANQERECEKAKAYRIANPESVRKEARERKRQKYEKDPTFKLLKLLRSRTRSAIKGVVKSARTLELLGCSTEHLRNHLEAQFQPGMTWKNHGTKGWHIDHKRPCASFNLADPAQQKECFHWTNLQPLWAIDNIIKGANCG